MIELHCGDVLDVLAGRRAECEAVVQDPPSGIAFMGLRFDLDHGGEDKWIAYMAQRFAVEREACIPGAYGLYWALPRTQDWTMQALRRAGYKIVDVAQHFFGQGWPKGRGQLKPAQEAWILVRDPRGKVRPLNIDACRVRRSWAERPESWFRSGNSAKPDAEKISGAPAGNGIHAHEGGSWPPNLLTSHCAACRPVGLRDVRSGVHVGRNRVGAEKNSGAYSRGHLDDGTDRGFAVNGLESTPAWECLAVCSCGLASLAPAGGAPTPCSCGKERWWACPVAMLDEQSGERRSAYPGNPDAAVAYAGTKIDTRESRVLSPTVGAVAGASFSDSGGASRFYPQFHYDAKASRAERQAGCEGLLWVRDPQAPIGWRRVSAEEHAAAPEADRREGNVHSTIKPIGCGQDDGLMRWLVRLVTPEGGPVLDGMMGSGSTGVAARIEGRSFIGCDVDPGAVDIARARIDHWTPERHASLLKPGRKPKASPAPRPVAVQVPSLGPLFDRLA